MKNKRLTFLTLTLLFCACSQVKKSENTVSKVPVDKCKYFQGKWQGKAYSSKLKKEYTFIADRLANGTFITKFTIPDGKDSFSQIQRGKWTCEGNTVEIINLKKNGKDVSTTYRYEIRKANKNELVLVQNDGPNIGMEFTYKRVGTSINLD